MAAPQVAPGTSRRHGRRPQFHWELIACGFGGHRLVGTDAATIGPEDHHLVRPAGDDARWHRCLRCDSWVVLPVPTAPTRERVPTRDEIELPLRGLPLRDRFVLRLIAIDRAVHVVILTALVVAIFVFATHRKTLHADFTRFLNAFQGGLGGPVVANHGVLGELNHLFTISTTELYVIGVGLAVYTFVLAVEGVGLWYARRWAEYLTFFETGILVPFEIYELVTKFSPLKIVTLIVNLAIVAYLVIAHRLFGVRGGVAAVNAEHERDSGWPAVERATPPAGSVPPTASPTMTQTE